MYDCMKAQMEQYTSYFFLIETQGRQNSMAELWPGKTVPYPYRKRGMQYSLMTELEQRSPLKLKPKLARSFTSA